MHPIPLGLATQPTPLEALRDSSPSPSAESQPRQRKQPKRTRRLPTKYQNMTDISIFLQENPEPAPSPTFIESRRKEIILLKNSLSLSDKQCELL